METQYFYCRLAFPLTARNHSEGNIPQERASLRKQALVSRYEPSGGKLTGVQPARTCNIYR